MTKEQKVKIQEFIKNNNLTFKEGTRNTDSVILSGYSLYLGIKTAKELEKVIDAALPDADCDYYEELDRVFSYASENNYGKWWETETAIKTYKF